MKTYKIELRKGTKTYIYRVKANSLKQAREAALKRAGGRSSININRED